VGDWEGTVELAETVTVPPLCARIARCPVIRRDNSAVVKAPRNEAVLIDPEGLPGNYMARIVATLDASGSDPPVVEKSWFTIFPSLNPVNSRHECVNRFIYGDTGHLSGK
jgi:hypothetical protein